MINYIVFAGQCYYGGPGGYSYMGSFINSGIAAETADGLIGGKVIVDDTPDYEIEYGIEWAHVMNAETGEIVYEAGDAPVASHDEKYKYKTRSQNKQ